MTDQTSTQVPAVLGMFHVQLAARPRLVGLGVPVDLGWPSGDGPGAQHCWLDGSVDDWAEEWLTTGQSGPVAKEETFVMAANLVWSDAELDFPTLMATAFDVAGEIDRQLMDDFRIGGTADHAHVIGGSFGEDFVTDGGRRLWIERRIAVRTSWPRDAG